MKVLTKQEDYNPRESPVYEEKEKVEKAKVAED